MKNNQFLFLLVVTYFALGFINIHFAILGLVCMLLPFILLFRNRKKPGVKAIAPGPVC
jgi:LPXTG-motif cell wall-anchored protein